MVPFIEELLRKVQETQIGQRDYLEDGLEDGWIELRSGNRSASFRYFVGTLLAPVKFAPITPSRLASSRTAPLRFF
jgi:hypothetical protein